LSTPSTGEKDLSPPCAGDRLFLLKQCPGKFDFFEIALSGAVARPDGVQACGPSRRRRGSRNRETGPQDFDDARFGAANATVGGPPNRRPRA
jgi:hypothetical protein